MPLELTQSQIDAVDKLQNGCILCGGVGTGKSRTALAYYYTQNGGDIHPDSFRLMREDPQDLYIITTARKRDDLEWESEFPQFLLGKAANFYKHEIVIDSWNNIRKYVGVRGAFFIFDEQRVVGKGVWAKSFQKITKNNNWILLSATPGDTWQDYMQVFIANGFFKNPTEFYREHVIFNPRVKFPKIERYINVGRLIRLRNRILVDIEMTKLTEPKHEYIYADFDMLQYKSIIKNRWNPWKEKPIENASELCYCLRKVVNSDPSRQEALLELREAHPRLIVFYNFDYERDILLSLDYGEGVEVAEWSGHAHQPVPEGDNWVYLVQYTAGAEGWNCILTDTIVFYSRHYSYKIVSQACGRIDRMNTSYRYLHYYHLVSRASIDIMIGRALQEKKQFNETKFASKF